MIEKIVVIVLFILFFSWIGYDIYKLYKIEHNDCLEEIARNYCEDNNMSYESHSLGIRSPYFSCKEDERKIGSEQFTFLEEEVEECLK